MPRWCRCNCGPFNIRFVPPGILKPYILRLLSNRPMHGFEIMEEIFERTGRVWRPGPGTIYPTLSWLEENGYVEGVLEVRGEKARKPYRITPKGTAALKEYRTVRREGLESLEWMRNVWKDM